MRKIARQPSAPEPANLKRYQLFNSLTECARLARDLDLDNLAGLLDQYRECLGTMIRERITTRSV